MRRRIIPYNPKLKQLARELRKNMTLSEVLLWKQIRGKQMMGYDFHRQKPIDNYIVDFYCSELSLAIEIDGDSHSVKVAKDKARQDRLEALGVNFLRFSERDVRQNIEGVLYKINS
ncbi:MAG: endonuclease domain-containing protein [Chloroflexi bacterium]|nr:endonuclease domain-containing protein [Chloroflexota bacterium]